MAQIWKFPLDPSRPVVKMPEGAQLLHVEAQNDDICLWALVNPDPAHPTESRTFRVYGTGHTIHDPESLTFIGTVILYEGSLVFHVFEEVK